MCCHLKSNVPAGVSQFIVDGSMLAPGIYFYSVKLGECQYYEEDDCSVEITK